MRNVLTATGNGTSIRRWSRASCPVALVVITALAGCNHTNNADVMATVNGKAIMKTELDKAYQVQLGDAQQPQKPTREQADSLRLNVLRQLIDEEIVEQRAAKMNLTAANEEVDAKVTEMKAPYTEDQFNEKLKASNHTLDDVKHDIRRSLTFNKLLSKEIDSKINVTDTDVATYYNAHKSEYNLIETQFHLAQIQVTSVPSNQPGNLQNSKAMNDADAKKKIQALKNRLESGEDFATLAMNFSERPDTSSSGGDIGFVSESQMKADPMIFNAITKLKPGQITEILPLIDAQTRKPGGYAIYKLISREPAGQRELSDPPVQQSIRQQLREGRSQLLKSAYLEILRDQAKVQNFYAEQIFKNETH
ncbi:SurA N-terminal domain-containing protein [Edaphobacter modestus]|uniref:Peptidyl-prolyl cis-trans isomerase SurA n=1 Tax=Edaphobacter modestus TaxID=388466 RepID=A0A4Q7YWN3_9BACT|nr:SurA N-terminal domain-containing protein [Edaphobacter modestus]RZU42120.1 peptidyl-prolyl cis-trans isomerase SurA [Edaphobacter modestus]